MNKFDAKATAAGLVTYGVKKLLWPYRKMSKLLSQTQWQTSEQLAQFQLKQLKRTIAHAYDTVPFYRAMMQDNGLDQDSLQTLDDISKFPVLAKEVLRERGHELISTKYSRKILVKKNTGGTSGKPVAVWRDPFSIAREHAFVRRQFSWAGIGPSDCCAYLEGRLISDAGDDNPAAVAAYDRAMNEVTLSTFHLRADTVTRYIDEIEKHNVVALVAYPSAAFTLAGLCEKRGIKLDLRCVLTTSETLEDWRKRYITKVFGCPVYDFYGSAERVCYIHTCEKGSYHIVPEYGYTELHPAPPPNEDCFSIVSTGFWNYAMPLIRYQMGDLIKVSGAECSCGRAFPVVDRIVGRESTIITTPGGVQLGASAIEFILERILEGMYKLPVAAGRVLHVSGSELKLEFVADDDFTQNHHEQIENLFKMYSPDGMKYSIHAVDAIERTSRGKFMSFSTTAQ